MSARSAGGFSNRSGVLRGGGFAYKWIALSHSSLHNSYCSYRWSPTHPFCRTPVCPTSSCKVTFDWLPVLTSGKSESDVLTRQDLLIVTWSGWEDPTCGFWSHRMWKRWSRILKRLHGASVLIT